LTAADLNGDGRPHLATANLGSGDPSGDVSVLLNEGDGSLARSELLLLASLGLRDVTTSAAEPRLVKDINTVGDSNPWFLTETGDRLVFRAPATTCLESADTNNDGKIDISDGIHLLNWLFIGGPELASIQIRRAHR
jgi:hypothetical protein